MTDLKSSEFILYMYMYISSIYVCIALIQGLPGHCHDDLMTTFALGYTHARLHVAGIS